MVRLSIKESRTAQGAFSSIGSKKSGSDQEHYKRTVARIESIQSHISQSPRRMRLKDKVCVITGVGSMKGIGYGCLNLSEPFTCIVDFRKICRRASALLYAHEGTYPDRSNIDLQSEGSNKLECQVPDICTCWTSLQKIYPT